jgi:hypothetical protein
VTRPRWDRSTVHDKEARATALTAALRGSGEPGQIDLADRLQRCQRGRADRRQGIPSDWPPMCRSVACPFCHRWLAKGWRARAAAQMAHADNEACSMVTVMLARSGRLDAIRDVVHDLRVALRNLRDRLARKDRRWCTMEMVGVVEIDAVGPGDIALLPPRRCAVVEALPLVGGAAGYATWDQIVTWVSHVHIACHAPHLSRGDLREVFGQQWPAAVPGRVDVRPFRDGKAGDNAGGIIDYAAKFEMRMSLRDGFDLEWPMPVQAAYFGWLHDQHNGMATLRVRIGPIADKHKSAPAPVEQDDYALPMPMILA